MSSSSSRERWIDKGTVSGKIPTSARERERSAEMEDGQHSLRGLDAAAESSWVRERERREMQAKARAPRAEIPVVTDDLGSDLGKTAGLRLISERGRVRQSVREK